MTSINLEPRFTRGEYWLLENVVQAAFPLSFLTTDNLGEIVNKQPHGLNKEGLVSTLS